MMKTAHDLVDQRDYLYHPEVDCLHRLAARIKPTVHHCANGIPIFINIGAGAGTSTVALLEGNLDAIVFSIDIHCGENENETNEHINLKYVDPAFAKRVIRIWGDSFAVGKSWPFGVDLVFIDGDHGYAGVKLDIEAWYDKIWSGGIIAFHDYGLKMTDGSEQFPGVRKAVDEFTEERIPLLIDQVGMIKAFEV
jgi:predicted O-methyltransferase YrrM